MQYCIRLEKPKGQTQHIDLLKRHLVMILNLGSLLTSS